MKHFYAVLFLIPLSLNAQWTSYNTSNSNLSSNATWFVYEDNLQKLWVATNAGLNLFDIVTNTWTNYNTTNSGIGHNDIHGIAKDNAGKLWVGTFGGGISSFNGSVWTNYNTTNSPLPVNFIYHIAYDSVTNSLWAGTRYGGLVKYNITTDIWSNYDSSQGLTDDVIDDIAIAANGDIWIACRYDGVAVYNGTSFQYYTVNNSGISGNDIYSINIDPTGKVWAGATTGLSVFDGVNWTNYTTFNSSITGNYIRQIEFDAFGNAWVSTGGGGILKFNGSTTWTSYNLTNSNIPSSMIWSASLTNNNSIWISTITGGIAIMDSIQVPDTIATRMAQFAPVPPTIFTGIKSNDTQKSEFVLFPNPSHNMVTFKNTNVVFVEIYSTEAKRITEGYTNGGSIMIGSLKSGNYVLRLYDKAGIFIGATSIAKN